MSNYYQKYPEGSIIEHDGLKRGDLINVGQYEKARVAWFEQREGKWYLIFEWGSMIMETKYERQ